MPPADKSITLVWELPHPPSKVWRALTDPALVSQWLMSTEMPAETGKAFTFRVDPMPGWDGIVHSEVLELEPQKRLRYTWKGGPGKLALDTVVTWSLVAVSGGTRLELEHSGFKEDQGQAFGGAKWGWEKNAGERLPAVLKTMA